MIRSTHEDEDASPLSLLPPKLQAIGIFITLVTIPGAISLFVVWMQTSTLPKIMSTLIAMQIEERHHAEDAARASAEEKLLLEQILLTQRIICEQGEKTLEGKLRCSGK
jgi:hypothetical protein